MATNPNFFDPITRRQCLRVGAFGAAGLTLTRILELLDSAPLLEVSPIPGLPPIRAARKRPTSAILLWLDGGASHIDTFDPKPNAPDEIRGNWGTVPTPIPGVLLGQGMEGIAKILPKCALIRSLASDAGEHEVARHLLLTGYPQTPSLEYPNYGSIVASLVPEGDFPAYLYVSPFLKGSRQLGAGFLPAENNPFAIESDPNKPGFAVRDLLPPKGISEDQVTRRYKLSQGFDELRRSAESAPAVRARSSALERAYRLVSSQKSREAFDLTKEPDAMRDRYGRNVFGQSCLLARRLVEAGARFVTVNDGSWDTHAKCQEHLSIHRIPKLNQAIPTLMADLEERGMLDDVFVLMMGEFGRTPKININDGRDHWPGANCAFFFGAGVKKGAIVGATDEKAESVVERPVSPSDLAATLYTLLGIDPNAEVKTEDNRPVKLVKDGTAVREILA